MTRGVRLAVFLAGAAGLAVLYVLGSVRSPDFGGAFHPYGERAVQQAGRRLTPNVVSSVNFDQRAFDTIGEELILIASAIGAVLLLRTVRREHEDEAGAYTHGPADVFDALRITGYALLPVTLLAGSPTTAGTSCTRERRRRRARRSTPGRRRV